MFVSILCFICYAQTNNGTDIECKDTTTCSARGRCIEDDDGNFEYCLCDDGYTTHPEPNITQVENGEAGYCNYEQKEQLIAFLLSLFLGYFAVGRFYCELFTTAAVKLALTVGFPCIMCCISICVGGGAVMLSSSGRGGSGGGAVAVCMSCLMIVWALAVFAWALADVILFGINKIQDGNGVELAAW